MKTPLIITENEQLVKTLYFTFKKSNDKLLRNEIYSLMLQSQMQLKITFDPNLPKNFIKSMERIRGIWSKLQSMLLIAEMLGACNAAQIEKCLLQIEAVQKISFGLLRHIESRKNAKKEKNL
jgi:hypothetical protein